MKYFMLSMMLLSTTVRGEEVAATAPSVGDTLLSAAACGEKVATTPEDVTKAAESAKKNEVAYLEALRRCTIFTSEYVLFASSKSVELPADDARAKAFQVCIGLKRHNSIRTGRDHDEPQSWSMWLHGQKAKKAETAEFHMTEEFGGRLEYNRQCQVAHASFLAAHAAAAEACAQSHAQTPEGLLSAAQDAKKALDAAGSVWK